MTTGISNASARYPLIVVDWSKDRDDYGSGWLRLIGPADLTHLRISATTQAWDGGGRQVAIDTTGVTVTSAQPDPTVRDVLVSWRSRAPIPLISGGGSGETVVPFLIDDVIAASSRLSDDGRTPRPSTLLRMIPIFVMLICAVLLIPLVRIDTWGVGLVAVMYAGTVAWLHRWSYPAGEWGDPPRSDPPDWISETAVASKVVFWSVAGAAATLALLDWTELLSGFVSWA